MSKVNLELLNRSLETLSEDNDRLHKELARVKKDFLKDTVTETHKLFVRVWNRQEIKRIPWLESYCGDSGFKEGALHLKLGMNPGQFGKGIDKDGRRVLLHATPFGNIVFFELSPEGEPFSDIIANAPEEIQALLPVAGRVDEQMLRFIFNTPVDRSWGARVDSLIHTRL